MSKLILFSLPSAGSAERMAEAAGSLAEIALTAFAGLRRRIAARSTLAKLSALDDRTLRDIGLDRSELASVSFHVPFERRRHSGYRQ